MTPGAGTHGVSASARRAPLAGVRAVLRELYARPASATGTTLVALFALMALVGPYVAPYGPTEQILAERSQAPGLEHWFGTDRLGRDVFSRIVRGARDIFALAGGGTALAVLAGTLSGLLTSTLGGWWEEITFRVYDALLAIPALLLALLLLGTLGPSRNSVLLVIAVAYTPIVARVVRSVVLSVKTRDWVAAARMQGEPLPWILSREILPSVLPALAVESALRFSYAIFLVASLGFLGVGVQPPNPDWGLMVSEARDYVYLTPWSLAFPAAAISLLVVSVNLAADGLGRALRADT
ncbi:MAG: ABC transporter permease [Trueperaceae bacterium]|nr:ABC transporter permease [Trueperaceae bacterium]